MKKIRNVAALVVGVDLFTWTYVAGKIKMIVVSRIQVDSPIFAHFSSVYCISSEVEEHSLLYRAIYFRFILSLILVLN